MKKLLATMMAAMLLLLAACQSSPVKTTSPSESATASATETAAVSPAETATAAEATAETPDPYGKYAEPITISLGKNTGSSSTFAQGDSEENNIYTRWIKDKLNIDVQYAWLVSGSDYGQKVNLCIAGNNMPDALVVDTATCRKAAGYGMLADMTEVIDQYASPYVKKCYAMNDGGAIKSATLDGKVYGIPNTNPTVDTYPLLWARKDWLDKLGLKPPQTLADVENIAQAFKDKDPDGNGKNDTFGISGPNAGGALYANFLSPLDCLANFNPIFFYYGAFPGYWLKDASGQVNYGTILPETKKALATLRDWYAKGLIDPQMAVRKDWTQPVIAEQSGMFFGPWWMGYYPFPDALKNNPKANWQAYLLTDQNGQYSYRFPSPSSSDIIVNKNYAHPEAAMKIFNINMRDENAQGITEGVGNQVLRQIVSRSDSGEYEAQCMADVLAGKSAIDDPSFDFEGVPQLKDDLAQLKQTKLEPYDNNDIQFWNTSKMDFWMRDYSMVVGVGPVLGKQFNKVYSELNYLTDEMTTQWTTLSKLESQAVLKIVMGSESIDYFDTFVSEWKKSGGDELTNEVRAEVAK